MKETFKMLNEESAAPEEVRGEVFKTLDTIQLMADILDLFTFKFTETESKIIESMMDFDDDEDEKE